jgi:adenylosuccinate lyase
MPQKVNPWFLEEAEGFLVMANDMLNTFIRNNDKSRMQRDMT